MRAIDAARQAFLLTLCERGTSAFVARKYLAEKVERIFNATDPHQIRAMLSPTDHARFDAHLHRGMLK